MSGEFNLYKPKGLNSKIKKQTNTPKNIIKNILTLNFSIKGKGFFNQFSSQLYICLMPLIYQS